MRVELYGIARARAGCEAVELPAASLGEVLAALGRRCPDLVPEVLGESGLAHGYLVSLNGERFLDEPGHALAESDTLVILGAQAGG